MKSKQNPDNAVVFDQRECVCGGMGSWSAHVEVRLPVFSCCCCQLLHEHEVVGAMGLFHCGHAGFAGGSVAFFRVAPAAGGDEVFPRVFTSAGSWDDVVYGERRVGFSAVLALKGVTADDVFAVQHDPFVGNPHKYSEADNAGHWIGFGDGADEAFGVMGDRYGLAAEEKEDGFLAITHTQRLIAAVEHQDF